MERNTWNAKVYPGPPRQVWISIPTLPPSLNVWTRKHWRIRHQEVKEMARNLKLLALSFNIPCFEKAEVKLTYYFRDKRRRDPDNYVGKFILDGLRKAGIIAEDNAEVLKLPQPEFKIDPQAPRTEVIIREWT